MTGALGFDMRQALQLEPGDPVLYSNRSLCHLRLKAHSEARTQRHDNHSAPRHSAMSQNLKFCCQRCNGSFLSFQARVRCCQPSICEQSRAPHEHMQAAASVLDAFFFGRSRRQYTAAVPILIKALPGNTQAARDALAALRCDVLRAKSWARAGDAFAALAMQQLAHLCYDKVGR